MGRSRDGSWPVTRPCLGPLFLRAVFKGCLGAPCPLAVLYEGPRGPSAGRRGAESRARSLPAPREPRHAARKGAGLEATPTQRAGPTGNVPESRRPRLGSDCRIHGFTDASAWLFAERSLSMCRALCGRGGDRRQLVPGPGQLEEPRRGWRLRGWHSVRAGGAGGRPQSSKGLVSCGDEHRFSPTRNGKPQRVSSPERDARSAFSLGRFWEETGVEPWRRPGPGGDGGTQGSGQNPDAPSLHSARPSQGPGSQTVTRETAVHGHG